MIRVVKSPQDLEKVGKGDVVVVEYYVEIPPELGEKAKAVVTASTGYDNLKGMAGKVPCYHVPDYGTETVAEYALLLTLAALRKFHLILESVKGIEVDHSTLRGRELWGKTVGVIGTGRIGTAYIRLLQPFNVKVLAYSRRKRPEVERLGVEYVPLEKLLRESDVVSLHVPLTKDTYHMIGERELSLMKDGAVLINTSRGAVVDAEGLARHADRIYAALDVVEGEEWINREKDIVKGLLRLPTKGLFAEYLVKHPHIIVTPHVAYNTEEANRRRWEKAMAIAKAIEEDRWEEVEPYRVREC